jgi:putative ABC transport system permease protein
LVDPGLQPSQWEILPRAGTDLEAYRSALQEATNNGVSVEVVASSATDTGFLLYEGVIGALGLVLIVISLGGVFNTVLLETRQRARETAILKSIGMTPAQTLVMVVASVVPVGVVAGLIGVPLGIAFQHVVLSFMGQAADRTAIPASVFDTFPPVVLLALGLSGLAIGALGAYLPAQRAARSRIATVLQAE